MALNWAQLLVHDDEALARFRANHRIPDDVLIERPSPNNATDWVKGEGNRIPVRTWFIHQDGLRFSLRNMLKKVMSLCRLTFMQVSINFVRIVLAMDALTDDPNHFSISRHRGYILVGFNARYWRRSERCVAAIRAVNNFGRTRKVVDLLGSSLSIEVNDLIKGIAAELRRLEKEAEGESTGSSSSSSSDLSSSWDIDLRAVGDEEDGDVEVEDDEEVNQVDNQAQVPSIAPLAQVPATKPILVLSSDSEAADDLNFLKLEGEGRQHSTQAKGSRQKEGYGGRSRETDPQSDSGSSEPSQGLVTCPLPPRRPAKGKGSNTQRGLPVKRKEGVLAAPLALPSSGTTFAAVDLGKQVTTADTSKDHKTCLALRNVIMLPQDVVDLAAEDLEEFGGRLVMMDAQKIHGLEKELKQARSELANARNAVENAIEQRNNALQEMAELQKMAYGTVYRRVFDCTYNRPRDTYEKLHPDLPAAYSPILLLGFDEEEYANMPPEGGGWRCCCGPEQQTCPRAKFGALVEFRANFFLTFAEYTRANPRGTEFEAIMELG
ncbi:hypothetical protein Acr_14g0002130 [Actinidia rufa]|uniref:Uncharacterized protein n=1 Tax=Actinidia rufa TaxID=165716 RepID=A0A7J0FRN5_9ERIC|nr:hypothetical protein Acr_14g0002130 [Actinidia rufa]